MVVTRSNMLAARELHETLLGRAELLDYGDRVLLEQVIEHGLNPREVAALSGASVRSVQRRVKRLVDRLSDRRVLWVMRNYQRWGDPVGPVGLGVWVKGWTLREAAERLGVSLYEVRRSVTEVKGMLRGVESGDVQR